MEFRSYDGKTIYLYVWDNINETKNPKGIVQIIHGMTEHAKRYEAFAEFLNKNGYIVVADDHRGHGKTDPDSLGYAAGNMFEDTVRDEIEITKHFKNVYPGVKYFIFGFSYGSFITQSYIGRCQEAIDGAVISGSNKKKDFEVYLGLLLTSVSNILGRERKPAKLIEKLSFGSYAKKFDDKEWLSNDAENNKSYHNDPLCGFTCSNRFYHDFFSGLIKLYTNKYKNSLKKELPLLLYSGKQDPVGNMGKGVKKLYNYYTEKANMTDVKLILLDGYRHEILGVKKDLQSRYNEILEFFQNH